MSTLGYPIKECNKTVEELKISLNKEKEEIIRNSLGQIGLSFIIKAMSDMISSEVKILEEEIQNLFGDSLNTISNILN